MEFEQYKEQFKQFFLEHIEAHLNSPLDTAPDAKHNQPYNVIERTKNATMGEFSRILDEFVIPVPTYEEFKSYIKAPNSIGSYMQTLLETVLPAVLNQDKTALNQKLIDALNHHDQHTYRKMLDKAQNNPQLIASLFLRAMVIGYSQQMLDKLNENDKAAWFEQEAVEFTFVANYVTMAGIHPEVQKPIVIDKEQLRERMGKLQEIYEGADNPVTNNLDRAQLFLELNPIKSLEAYLKAAELALQEGSSNQLSDMQLQALDNILSEDVFLQTYGQFPAEQLAYCKAYVALSKVSSVHGEVNQAASNLLRTVKKLNEQSELSASDLLRISKYLNDTATFINNPESKEASAPHYANIKDVTGKNRSWGPVIGGALLCLAGVLLVAAAITVTVLTFGVASPLTIPTAAVGSTMTASGIAMTVGIAVGLTATAAAGIGLASKGGMFAHRAAKGPIATAMDEVSDSIERTHRI